MSNLRGTKHPIMERLGFLKATNHPGPGQPRITHSRPAQPSPPPVEAHWSYKFRVANAPGNQVVLANCIGVNAVDFDNLKVNDRGSILLDGNYVVHIYKSDKVAPGTIGLSGSARAWGKWSLDQEVLIEPYNIFNKTKDVYLGTLELLISHVSRGKTSTLDHGAAVAAFKKQCHDQILQPTQTIVLDFAGVTYYVTVTAASTHNIIDGLPNVRESTDLSLKGINIPSTEINFFAAEGSNISIVNAPAVRKRGPPRKPIINPDFKLEDLGIGGLDSEFQDIFRRAFNSRILPPDIAEKLDYKHCKGLLLFGPPGTGKTLIARKLSKMLNGREPKIVNGPEMLSKYVGASEENIRNLFKEAEAEYKKKGDESELHVIIFDELDSVFKQRGSGKSDGTGVGDNVVNQLLSKMDGVDQLNNILVIGMTNRLDLIDTALLRPGRFEIQIEIALPDEKGRRDILLIHTAKLRENKLLAADVDIDDLAARTKNFTGAELEGLCNSAKSFAISRHTKSGSVAEIDASTIDQLTIEKNDFLLALEEVSAAFGTNEEDLNQATPHGIIPYSHNIQNIFNRGQSFVDEVRSSATESLISILLYGPPGVGKTAIAATLARNSEFPFIKLLSAEALVGMSEGGKIAYIDNVFRDVYKSPLNILVIDKIETLINYVPIGPRFSNDILQLLTVYLTKKPPKGRRLLILATTSQYSVLKTMNLVDSFTNTIAVPGIKTVEEIGIVLDKVSFKKNDIKSIVDQLSEFEINIGIKKLLQVLMNSKYLHSDAAGVVENLIELMQ